MPKDPNQDLLNELINNPKKLLEVVQAIDGGPKGDHKLTTQEIVTWVMANADKINIPGDEPGKTHNLKADILQYGVEALQYQALEKQQNTGTNLPDPNKLMKAQHDRNVILADVRTVVEDIQTALKDNKEYLANPPQTQAGEQPTHTQDEINTMRQQTKDMQKLNPDMAKQWTKNIAEYQKELDAYNKGTGGTQTDAAIVQARQVLNQYDPQDVAQPGFEQFTPSITQVLQKAGKNINQK